VYDIDSGGLEVTTAEIGAAEQPFAGYGTYEEYRAALSRFLWSEIAPRAAEIDATNHFPRAELFPRLAELGLWGLMTPSAYGGGGLTVPQYLPIVSEMAKVSGGTRLLVHAHNSTARALALYASDDQKRSLLPRVARGELSIAFALTEPDSGSGKDVQTTARREGNRFILSGKKHLITNADFTELFLVLCHATSESGEAQMTALLLPRDTPGLQVELMGAMMGCRGTGHARLTFDDCPVPVESVVGREDQGLEVFLGELEAARVFIAASSLGVCERALELATAYAKQRVTFGKPIAQRETVREYLADMFLDTYALRVMLADVAGKIERGEPAAAESSACKVFGSEAVCRVTDRAMLVFGGRGYASENEIERLYRDARLNLLEEGTPTIQRFVVARALLDG
jgi:alkylation response protein AidB-like acyl-CoA dehydrogenase